MTCECYAGSSAARWGVRNARLGQWSLQTTWRCAVETRSACASSIRLLLHLHGLSRSTVARHGLARAADGGSWRARDVQSPTRGA